jgi:predicted transcriptional regulator
MATTQHQSTKHDILQLLLKQAQATAQELAETLDISPQAIRRHLKDLEMEGLIAYNSVQVGMGRPQHVYELTTQGREHFPNRYDEFAISFLDTLTQTVGHEQVSQILHKQWQRKAIEYRENSGTMAFDFGTDGSGYEAIMIKDGGFRNPTTLNSFEVEMKEDGKIRNDLQSILNPHIHIVHTCSFYFLRNNKNIS